MEREQQDANREDTIVSKPKVAVVAVASRFESGGERAVDILEEAKKKLAAGGLEVRASPKIVWDAADAIQAAGELAAGGPDLLAIIHVTWVQDSLQYLFVSTVRCPVLLWAVPYTETFSLGCILHFSSVLSENGIPFRYVYGLPDRRDLVVAVRDYALAAGAFRALKGSRIALIGPRQTWRAAGPQDMTIEEWNLSKTFGVTILHVEMEELLAKAAEQTEAAAEGVLKGMEAKKRLGNTAADKERLLYAAKVYLGVKELFGRYGLTSAAAECYPQYGGLVNLPSSWLADEGTVLDTEGDIGHTMLMEILNLLSPGATALAEVGSINERSNSLDLAHEGSSAHSLAGDPSKVRILPGGDKGTVVGFPLKVMPKVTVTDLCGQAGNYRLFAALARSQQVPTREWVRAGSKFMARLSFGAGARGVLETMVGGGVDHHLLLREGDLRGHLRDLCDLWGIDQVAC
jgi:L-fucose isomerase-like protein